MAAAAFEFSAQVGAAAPQISTTDPGTTPGSEPRESDGPALPKALSPRREPRTAVGLTGRGVCALIAVTTFVGGLLDLLISGHRGHLFGILFIAASAVGALGVRKRDLTTALVAPPLVYCVLIFVMSLIDRSGLSGGLLTREAFYLGNAFVTGAPAIWTGSLLAAAIGWYRTRAAKH